MKNKRIEINYDFDGKLMAKPPKPVRFACNSIRSIATTL